MRLRYSSTIVFISVAKLDQAENSMNEKASFSFVNEKL